jgi:hypothetical protein
VTVSDAVMLWLALACETGRLRVLRSGQRARCEDGDGQKAERGAPGRSSWQPPRRRARGPCARGGASPRRRRFLPRASPRVLCKPSVLKTKQWKSERRSECDNKSYAMGLQQASRTPPQACGRRWRCSARIAGLRARLNMCRAYEQQRAANTATRLVPCSAMATGPA